jgi:linoleoyl-CoA desaturase
MPLKKMGLSDHLIFWSFKSVHFFLFVGLPVYRVGLESWFISFLIFALVAGFVLSLVFQLAHTVEHTAFPVANGRTGKMEDEWAIHQLKTTANFATKNKLVTWLVGGLNFQIEHHLFPKISHIHYPAIGSIIKKICEDRGIDYIEFKNVRFAIASHVAFLKQMGR